MGQVKEVWLTTILKRPTFDLEVVRKNKNMALGATNDAVLTPCPSIVLCAYEAYQQGLPYTVAT